MSSATSTQDHEIIRTWIESRGGRPTVVRDTHDTQEGGGILRVDFGEPEDNLERISWDEFFKIFDERGLQFLYQEETNSRFFKFVRKED